MQFLPPTFLSEKAAFVFPNNESGRAQSLRLLRGTSDHPELPQAPANALEECLHSSMMRTGAEPIGDGRLISDTLQSTKNEVSPLFSQEQDIADRWDELTVMRTEYSRYLIDLRSRFRLNSPEYALNFFRSKITEQTPQYSVCLSLDYEKLQDWLNKTVYNVNYGAPMNLHSDIVTSYDSRPGRGACEPENYDPSKSTPISAHKVLPGNGGDDPTIPSDLSP